MFASALVVQQDQQDRRQRQLVGQVGRSVKKARRAMSHASGGVMIEGLEARQLLAVTPTSFISTDVPKTTPIQPILTTPGPVTPSVATSGLLVNGVTDQIANVTVTVNITDSTNYYLGITLISPSGTRVPLVQQNPMQYYYSGYNYINTTFDDAAPLPLSMGMYPYTGSFQPASPLSALAGETANGIWHLELSDSYGYYADRLNSWSITLTPAVPPAQISGLAWDDTNRNGVRDNTLISVSGNATVIYGVDVSLSSVNNLVVGATVGDVNGDGAPNTLLDTELAGYIALNQNLITRGFGSTKVAILIYADTAKLYNNGLYNLNTTVSADSNNNGTPDIEEALKAINFDQDAVGTGLNFHAALQEALTSFTTLQTATGDGTFIFTATTSPLTTDPVTDDVAALTAAGVNFRPFIFGTSSLLTSTQYLAAFGDSDQVGVTFTEAPVVDRRIYLDLNNNGVWDSATEPTTLTDSSGAYSFAGLIDNTYVVREILPAGWVQTTPDLGAFTVNITPEGILPAGDNLNFGAYETGQISGFAWDDQNQNGARGTTLFTGAHSDIIIAIDVSDNANATFPGAIVGDVNNDGVPNTVLDVELAAVIALNDSLMARGLTDSARLTVIAYADTAAYVHLVPSLIHNDLDYAIRPSLDVDAALQTFHLPRTIHTGLNYLAALQLASSTFSAINTPIGSGTLLLLSAGLPSDTTPLTAAVTALQKQGITRHALAIGNPAAVAGLQLIDASAYNIVNSDNLVAIFGGQVDGANVSYTEPGIAGLRIFIDQNNDGVWQEGTEPSTLTNGAGQFFFNDLPFGDYVVRQLPQEGWVATSPVGGMRTVVLAPGQPGLNEVFGNVAPATLAGHVYNDAAADIDHEAGPRPLADVTVFLDNDHDGLVTLAHTVTNVDGTTTSIAADPVAITDADGAYSFNGLAPATYDVRTIAPANMTLLSPFGGVVHQNVLRGQIVSGVDFIYHVPAAQITVTGNGNNIANHSIVPSVSNLTDFGAVALVKGSLTRTFFIRNRGDASLLLTGHPVIAIAGATGDFKVLRQPAVFLRANASASFKVVFTPRAAGIRNARITIASSDANQPVFTFVVRGNGGPVKHRAVATRATVATPARSVMTAAATVFNSTRRIGEDQPVW